MYRYSIRSKINLSNVKKLLDFNHLYWELAREPLRSQFDLNNKFIEVYKDYILVDLDGYSDNVVREIERMLRECEEGGIYYE